jgi:hypothetical protein
MLYNKTVDLVAGESYTVPGHASAICFYVSGDSADIDVSPDGTNWYSLGTIAADSVSTSSAYPFVKYEQNSGSTVVKLGICTHKHGS